MMNFTLRAAGYAAVAPILLASIAISEPSFALESAFEPTAVPPSVVPTLEIAVDTLIGRGDVVSNSTPVVVPQPAPPVAAYPKASRTLASLVSDHSASAAADREADCLAGAVYFEAKGESLEGQLAVADVVVNRAQSGGRFPSSICSVVFQRGQFSFVRNNGFPPIARDGRAWKRAVAIAHIAMGDMWDSKAGKALFFHASRVSPGWRKQRVATIGNHVFYR